VLRQNISADIVIDGRKLALPRAPRYVPEGRVPTVFEFAAARGVGGRLTGPDGRSRPARIVAIVYLGDRIFDMPGGRRSRFGVLLAVRGTLAPGRHALAIPSPGLESLVGIPVHPLKTVPPVARGANALILVG
jgi:hypothetical protein